MPIKLSTEDKNGIHLTPTPKSKASAMVREYLDTLHKMSTNSLQSRFPDRTFPDGSSFCEAKSAWVSKSDIEQLLSDNNGSDGIRIYYGCHNESTIKEAGVEYLGMHNVILVATKSVLGQPGYKSTDLLNESENLNEANSIIIGGSFEGNAGDLTPLCPPRCPDKSLP